MKIRAKDLFSGKEREAIRQAVRDAESGTSGEIAVALVDESDRYLEAEFLGALAFAAGAAFVAAVLLRFESIWFYLPLTAFLYIPALALIRRFPQLKLAWLFGGRVEEAVRERALALFYERGLNKTRARTGVLIFISLLERRVWILGDEGINRKITPEFWEDLVQELTGGIRTGRPAEALRQVIEKCGAALAEHFKAAPGNANELPDELIHE